MAHFTIFTDLFELFVPLLKQRISKRKTNDHRKPTHSRESVDPVIVYRTPQSFNRKRSFLKGTILAVVSFSSTFPLASNCVASAVALVAGCCCGFLLFFLPFVGGQARWPAGHLCRLYFGFVLRRMKSLHLTAHRPVNQHGRSFPSSSVYCKRFL